MKDIWVFIEQDDGELEGSSLEVLSKARELGDKYGYTVSGILFGSDVKKLLEEASRYGADRIIYVDDENLRFYNAEAYSKAMVELARKYNPNTILFSATRNGRDLAGRVAIPFNSGLLAHVISLDFDEEGRLTGRVPGFGGSIAAVVKCINSRPQLATVTPGVFEAKTFDRECKYVEEKLEVDLTPDKYLVISREKSPVKDISKSEKVVVAGQGTGGELDIVYELAKLLNADVGVTRPLADRGLAPRDIQIGSTGVNLKSKLVIVLGASGAPHFVSGIKDCDLVISINKDADAPIKEHSDYFVVADIFKVVPKLLELLRGGGDA